MATEVKMTLANLKRGGEAFAVKASITSIDKPIEHMQRDRREYYERYRKYTRQSGVADASEIQVYINSQGGRVDSAIGITTALCMYKKPMRILIDGSCCSAATLLLELPAPVYITPTSRIYLHAPMRMRYKRDKKIRDAPGDSLYGRGRPYPRQTDKAPDPQKDHPGVDPQRHMVLG